MFVVELLQVFKVFAVVLKFVAEVFASDLLSVMLFTKEIFEVFGTTHLNVFAAVASEVCAIEEFEALNKETLELLYKQ